MKKKFNNVDTRSAVSDFIDDYNDEAGTSVNQTPLVHCRPGYHDTWAAPDPARSPTKCKDSPAIHPGSNVTKHFMFVIYQCTRVLVPGNLSQPSLMFAVGLEPTLEWSTSTLG
jgi:hypothetical protein